VNEVIDCVRQYIAIDRVTSRPTNTPWSCWAQTREPHGA